jgi:hypothetical protein
MKRTGTLAGLVALGMAAVSAPVQAGLFADDMARCIVNAATPADRTAIMSWMFGMLSSNPAVSRYANIKDADRTAQVSQFAKIAERLVLEDCRALSLAALKNEGPKVIESAFQVLGEVAMRDRMAAPETREAMAKLDAAGDKARWKQFAAEAGLTVP